MRLLSAASVLSLVFLAPALGQDLPATQVIGGFTVSSLPSLPTNAFCAVTGPLTATFQAAFIVTKLGNNIVSIINTTWKLTPTSRGSVTLRTGDRTLKRDFVPAAGDAATTRLSSVITPQDPDSTAAGFAFTMFLPGVHTDVVFPGGQTFKFDAPPAETNAAFKICLDRMWGVTNPADPFAPKQ